VHPPGEITTLYLPLGEEDVGDMERTNDRAVTVPDAYK
jgi:hypothetical protein